MPRRLRLVAPPAQSSLSGTPRVPVRSVGRRVKLHGPSVHPRTVGRESQEYSSTRGRSPENRHPATTTLVRVQQWPTEQAWSRLAIDLDARKLDAITTEVPLAEAITEAARLMQGQVRGRIVVRTC